MRINTVFKELLTDVQKKYKNYLYLKYYYTKKFFSREKKIQKKEI